MYVYIYINSRFRGIAEEMGGLGFGRAVFRIQDVRTRAGGLEIRV